MRRWNGWGDDATTYPFPESAAHYLAVRLGEGIRSSDVTLQQTVEAVPASKLSSLSLAGCPEVKTETLERLLHARGQSFPDWVALRYGRIDTYPEGVIYPENDEQVCRLLEYARQLGLRLIPYGGGTSVVGHINPLPEQPPTLTVDLSQLNRLEHLDETSRLATFGAGISGPELEQQLNTHGFTLGHFPQSFELSTLGGWIASRSSGQQSYYYGRIEDLFAGGHVETSLGPLDLPSLPASAAGPDLRQVILGSEGRFGIITRAVVRIRPQPEREAFYGVFFRSWQAGVDAVRLLAQARIPVSMARLSNPQETDTTLALSGKDSLVAWAQRGLGWLGYGSERCLLVFGVTGSTAAARFAKRQALDLLCAAGGLYSGEMIGKMWRKSRFLTPYLRNVLWENGYAVDTLETALPWNVVLPASASILSALEGALLEERERVLAFCHLSHIYRDGASIYTTYLFRRTADPEQTLERWQRLKRKASLAVIQHGGTISHQHGVGLDHAPYLEAEKGPVGMAILRAMAQTLDPDQVLNPGKLLEK
jgi:alkyldihydroxyacetonephosphate synthase